VAHRIIGPFNSTISENRSTLLRASVREMEDCHLNGVTAIVSLSSKNIKGLRENDFIMASTIDQLLNRSDGLAPSSERLRYQPADLSHAGNEQSHRHRVRRNWLSLAAALFGICAITTFPSGSRQGIQIGAQTVWR
jgi:hypothetical protein